MLYVLQWSYIKNSQDWKVCNLMLIAPQWIHSVATVETCFYYYMYNKLWSLCMISKLLELLLFFLKFIDTCISAFHICINISDLTLCVWIAEKIYSKPSVITSLPEIHWDVCNCILYIHTYQCFSIYWMFEWKHLW